MSDNKSISSSRTLARRLKLRHLEVFRSVCEHGSVRGASEAVNIAQPAATKLIRDLEDMLGVPLFVRNRRGMVPTPHGELVRRHAGILFADVASLHAEVAALAQGQSGVLRLGVLPSLNSQLFAGSINRVLARWPAIRITVREGATTELLEALARNELDVTYGRILGMAQAKSLVAVPVYNEAFCVACSAGHPLAARRSVRWSDLVESGWALPIEGTPLRQLVDGIFARNGILRPHAIVECSGYEQIRHVVSHSALVGVLPRALASQARARGEIAILGARLEGDVLPISLVYRKDVEPSPLATAYIDLAMTLAQSMRLPLRNSVRPGDRRVTVPRQSRRPGS